MFHCSTEGCISADLCEFQGVKFVYFKVSYHQGYFTRPIHEKVQPKPRTLKREKLTERLKIQFCLAECVIFRTVFAIDGSDSCPVVFLQEIQRRERWVPTKGAQIEMGRYHPLLFHLARCCRVLHEDD